jgi:NAD(P)-dependent dehydrogenase (short-subunit alcohol dehydrogenase family)
MSDTRIALVTGANQGVGFQVAKELVANGVTVYLGSRNLQRGEAAAKEIGPGAIALQIDITDGASIAAAAERIRSERGRLDLLVNNAGISNTRLSQASAEERSGQSFLEDYVKSSKASTASLVAGRPHRQCVERGRLARPERRPLAPLPRQVRAHLSRVQGG